MINQLHKTIGAAIIVVASLTTVSLAGGATTAPEEQQLVPAQVTGIPFNRYVKTPGYVGALTQTINDFEKQFGDCAEAYYDGRVQIGLPRKPISIPGQKTTVPQWLEINRIEGCKVSYIRGVLVAMVDQKVNFYPLLKGNGVAGVFKQKEVLAKLLEHEKAAAIKAGCKEDDELRITQHDMVDKKKTTATGDWDEVWHLKNCKGPKYTQVTFRTGDDGSVKFSFQDVKEGK